MNYFELFHIPESFLPDKTEVQQQFYRLSKQYHPDFFTQATDEEQQQALEQSAFINKAYKTLTNKDLTLAYLLNLKGLLEDDEKYTLSNEFLMEVMELNEKMIEAKFEGDTATLQDLKSQINNLEQKEYALVKNIIENYNSHTTQEELLQVKEYYYRKKYLNRILDAL
jgi:molecular chaperone HscB